MVSNGSNSSIKGEAKGIFKAMRSFEFVFILFFDESSESAPRGE